jgi:hypothetical protein
LNSPILSGHLRSNIELERLSAIEAPKQRFELSGLANATIFFKGILPALKTFRPSDLNKLALRGDLRFENIYIKSLVNPLPPATVSGKITVKSLREINLEQIWVKTGNSSFVIDGTVTNIPVFEEDSLFVPLYRCRVESPEFHVEDFLIKENKKSTEITKAAFPDSIIVFANFNAQKFMFGKFEASNVSGDIQYQTKTLRISNFSMNSQEGTINSNINISQKEGLFITHCEANLQRIDISNMFYSFNNFGQTVISSENLGGMISGTVQVTAAWDQLLNPILDSIYLQSEIEINQGEIINYLPLMGLSRFIEVEELKHIRFDRLQTSINISQKTVFISQTDIRSSAISLTGSGEHYFDNSYIYHLQVQLSDILWKKAKKKKPENTEFGYIADNGLGRTTLPLSIKGKDTDFYVSYDKKTARNSFREKVIKEKNELHSLFAPSVESVNTPEDNQDNNVMQIEWNEDTANKKGPKQKNKTEEKKQEYSIEWKDE